MHRAHRSTNTASGTRTGLDSDSSPPPRYSAEDLYSGCSSDRSNSSINSPTGFSLSSSTLAPNDITGAGSRYNHHGHPHHVYDIDNVQSTSPGDNETSPLLSTPSSGKRYDDDNSDTIICIFSKNRLLAHLVLFSLILLSIGTYLVFFSKSALTSVWVDITPSDVCLSVGVREYTATLTNVPEDWDPLQACRRTRVTIHGKVIQASPILCTRVPVPSHSANDSESGETTVVQGKWAVDFDESDCIPVWSSISSEDCIGLGVRPYYADLVYIPPGLDKLSSCQGTPTLIHGREMLPTRCELLLDHDHDDHRNETLIARGEWDVDFDEDGCVPRWSEPLTAHECLSFGARHYSSDLVVPRGFETMAPTLARDTPAIIHGRHIFPNYFEQLDQDDGTQTVRGHWAISEPSCDPPWADVSEDPQCYAYDKKRYTGFLKDGRGKLDPLRTCYEVPFKFVLNGEEVEKKPDVCEWDGGRVRGTWFLGTPSCRPLLQNIIDYGCIESGSGFKRMKGEVVGIEKHDDWYQMCITVPYHTSGKTYLPVQCESTKRWFITHHYAVYNIPAYC